MNSKDKFYVWLIDEIKSAEQAQYYNGYGNDDFSCGVAQGVLQTLENIKEIFYKGYTVELED